MKNRIFAIIAIIAIILSLSSSLIFATLDSKQDMPSELFLTNQDAANISFNVVDDDLCRISTSGPITPAVGSVVFKHGDTSLVTFGSVLSLYNDDYWQGGYHVVDQLNYNAYTAAGDSGGLVYTRAGNTVRVAGIIRGGGGGVYSATKAAWLPWNLTIL